MSPSWVVAANCTHWRVSTVTHNHHRNNILNISNFPYFSPNFHLKTEVFKSRRLLGLLSQHPLWPPLAAVNWKEGGAIQFIPFTCLLHSCATAAPGIDVGGALNCPDEAKDAHPSSIKLHRLLRLPN